MDQVIEEARTIPVCDEADVVVCGGGVAGVAAAVGAARAGARVILLERYGWMKANLVIELPLLVVGTILSFYIRVTAKQALRVPAGIE